MHDYDPDVAAISGYRGCKWGDRYLPMRLSGYAMKINGNNSVIVR